MNDKGTPIKCEVLRNSIPYTKEVFKIFTIIITILASHDINNLFMRRIVLDRENERCLYFRFRYFAEVVHLLDLDSLFGKFVTAFKNYYRDFVTYLETIDIGLGLLWRFFKAKLRVLLT
jgi:hypothetical protein